MLCLLLEGRSDTDGSTEDHEHGLVAFGHHCAQQVAEVGTPMFVLSHLFRSPNLRQLKPLPVLAAHELQPGTAIRTAGRIEV